MPSPPEFDIFERDREWLAKQELMTDWNAGCQVLLRQMNEWVRSLSQTICGDDFLTRELEGRRTELLGRVWGCWGGHWKRAAVKQSENPEVTALLVSRVDGVRLGQKIRGDVTVGGQMDLVEEVLRVDAALLGNDRAMNSLIKTLNEIGRSCVDRRYQDMAEDWVQQLLMPREDKRPEVGLFSGLGAFAKFARLAFERKQGRQKDRDSRNVSLTQEEKSDGQSTFLPEVESVLSQLEKQDCLKLFATLIEKSQNELSQRERIVLRMRDEEQLSNLEVARVLERAPGVVSRNYSEGKVKLLDRLKSLIIGNRDAEACLECVGMSGHVVGDKGGLT